MSLFLTKLREFRAFLFGNRSNTSISNITNSTVEVNTFNNSKLVTRPPFTLSDEWFRSLLNVSYDAEIKFKYKYQLHEINDFERNHLTDVINFDKWKSIHINQIELCEKALAFFINRYQSFRQTLHIQSINITDPNHIFINQITTLFTNYKSINSKLLENKSLFQLDGYNILAKKDILTGVVVPIENTTNIKYYTWKEFLDRRIEETGALEALGHSFNQAYFNLVRLNTLISNLKVDTSSKIITGNAGTGKTHISAHLVNKVIENKDYALFFKAKQFNGNNINLSERFLQILNVPQEYNISEVLTTLNQFVIKRNKRCFIIIDALNETTKSSIGFSNIWSDYLQEFINLASLFSNLYVICTLRSSYIGHIWRHKPATIVETKGFENFDDLESVCKKYFNYYNIQVTNLEVADLSIFSVPLLLDLYCRLINESKVEQKEITLDMNTYLQIFEDYISSLTHEVKRRLNLQKNKSIVNGFKQSSEFFFLNNEAIIGIDRFSDAFDKDDSISEDNSIARSVLEGYLIFIKDVIARNEEVIKHTQQEVGGYLLATNLIEKFPNNKDLLNDTDFNDKILGNDPSKHHQLRLDILKFLIALRPNIITELRSEDALKLSWWYLYNGFDNKYYDEITKHLLSNNHNYLLNHYILSSTLGKWFRTDNQFNFNFIIQFLEQLDLWSFNVSWTLFLYEEGDSFIKLISDNIDEIRELGHNETNAEYYNLFSKFCAYAVATTVLNLRDLAITYLIEFGKIYPAALLELTVYCASLTDTHIYARLSSCCYGVALALQNDDGFVTNHLPNMSKTLFDLQFSPTSTKSSFNYIVTDSVKHLTDLALTKAVISLNATELTKLSNYQFTLPGSWSKPTSRQISLLNNGDRMNWPEPLGMDFAIYTIPRLINNGTKGPLETIANIYNRIFELGYRAMNMAKLNDELFKNFYSGSRLINHIGKVERLGKKYSWTGFYDYAGVLLSKGELNIYEKYSTNNYYRRLSDLDLDVCLPNKDYKTKERLYKGNLIDITKDKWHEEVFIDTTVPLFRHLFDEEEYILLNGKVDQRIDENYEIRSFLLIETFFIKRTEDIEHLKNSILDKVIDWDWDIHFPKDDLSNVYFGELYWADNIAEQSEETVSIRTGEKETIQVTLDIMDVINSGLYTHEDIGRIVEQTYLKSLHFESEPTLLHYLWETESKIIQGYSEYYPSVRMGKSLKLKSDPLSGNIIDANSKKCFYCVDFNENMFQNSFNYMRADLLDKYMQENDLCLFYQIKQHSYTKDTNHNRSMKFLIQD